MKTTITTDLTTALFFSSSHDPYYIYAPDYRQSSAGIRCLHYLCHSLNELGKEAYVTSKVTSPYLRTPRLSNEISSRHILARRNPIAVYPETVSGNPLKAPTVARWILNKSGHLGGDTHYAPSELLFYFDPWIDHAGFKGDILRIPTVDSRIFNNFNNQLDHQRFEICYYANKYLVFGGSIAPGLVKTGTSLCHNIARTHSQIATILRRSKVLYCYEHSAIIQEALDCGCPVIMVTSEYFKATDWPDHAHGTRLNTDSIDLDILRTELSDYQKQRQEITINARLQLDDFIEKTQACSRTQGLSTQDELIENESDVCELHRNTCSSKPRTQEQLSSAYFGAEPAATGQWTDHNLGGVLDPAGRHLLEARLVSVGYRPTFEFIVLASNVADDSIASTLESIKAQPGFRGGITVVTNTNPPGGLHEPHIKWVQPTTGPRFNGLDILTNSNADWYGFLRAGDRLAPHAIWQLTAWLDHHECAVLFGDELVVDDHGLITATHFKVDAKHRLADGGMPIGLLLAKREAWLAAGGWRVLPRGVAEMDAALRLHEACGDEGLTHIPATLLHQHPDNLPVTPPLPHICELRTLIVKEHLARTKDHSTVEPGLRPELCHLRPPLANLPKITAIVLTKDNGDGLRSCIRSLLEKTDYPALEILIVDNGTTEPSARAYLDNLVASAPGSIQVAAFNQPFNLATMCNAAAQVATGELVVFLHDDIEALHDNWLNVLAAQCLRQGVAMAGARLLSRDGTIQEAGIVPMQVGLVGSSFAGSSPDTKAPMGLLHVPHPVSAISAACMMVRRQIYLDLGGMDGQHFPNRIADIDFCLKLRMAGHQIMWTPYATLQHDSDGTTQGNRHDNDALLAKWGSRLTDDPCFNPHLTINSNQFDPETDPTFLPDPVTWHPLPNIFAALTDDNWTAKGRLEQTIESATAFGHIRGRVAKSLPAPVQLKRLDIDTVFCAAPLTPQQLREVSLYRQLLGCRIVMEIDQLFLLEFESADPLRHIRTCLHYFDRHVDQFTCSSDWLVNQLPKWRKRIQVVPETLSAKRWGSLPDKPFRRSEKMRVGWHITPSDLDVIASTIIDLADEVDWILLGPVPANLLPHAKERHQSVAYDDFPAKLAELNLDLAVLPLALTPKNQCRSHLPILEYGHLGIPVIASDIAGHQTGLPITLVENTDQNWRAAIRNHLYDRAASKRQGEALKQQVHNNWMFEQHIDDWLRAWTRE